MIDLPPVKNPKGMIALMLKPSPKGENDFDALIEATRKGNECSTIIQGYIVRIVPNPFSGRDLFSLFIGGYQSNSCLSGAMRKLLTEWKDGKRHIQAVDWANEGAGLLMKKY